LRNYFVILFAHVGLIISSKFFGQPESQVVLWCECVIKELSEHSKNTIMILSAKNQKNQKYCANITRKLKIAD